MTTMLHPGPHRAAPRGRAWSAHRTPLLLLSGATCLGAVAGTAMLVLGEGTPPDRDLPAGLHSWVLPGLWLLVSVAVPCGVTWVLAHDRSPMAPTAALVAAGSLLLELGVQVPFVGVTLLQLLFAGVAVLMAAYAWDCRPRRVALGTGRSRR